MQQKLELNSPSLYIPKEKTIVPQVSLLKDEKINLGDKMNLMTLEKRFNTLNAFSNTLISNLPFITLV
mgnify:CR=1 FL=1